MKFCGLFKILLVSILFTFVEGQRLYAQYYPVHATVQWSSPQSPYLSDYYSGSRDRLIVTLLNRDLQQPLLFAKLRIRIKSTGFLASSREEGNYPILELNANVPTRLTNIDLAPYLHPQNLQTNGNLRNGQLPVGYTEFSVQVIDYYTGRALSDWHSGRSYLDVKKPPLLNFPEKDAQIGITEPLYIGFQWMPRHQGLAGTEYEFVLKELPDNGAAPQSAFAYGNEIYRIRTRNTTLTYTHLEPILFPNRRYAWQVQAIARDGVDEVGMFENGGFSEINWFYLNDNCQAPTGLKALPRFAKVELSWNKVIGTTGYVVECRPKTKLNVYEWSSTRVAGEYLTLAQLKPGWTYEWRVGTLCTDDRPVFSDVHEFMLSSQNDELLADCGKEPVRPDLSQDPNLRIKAGDIVTIGGDYPMTIIEAVSLGDGWYSGRGKTRLKTIIDAPVSLRFDRLRINVDNFQIDGTVEASYDEKKAKIANLDYIDDGGKDIKPATIRMREYKMGFMLPDIPQFIYNPKTGELETTDADGNPQTIKVDVPENASYEHIFPILVTDNKGNTYQISPSEQSTEGTTNGVENENKDEKIELNCERVDRVGDFNTESLSSKYGYIHFERGEGKYAFDDGQEKWYKKSVKVDRFYKPFAKGYIAPWKLVPVSENDIVMAKYDGLKNIDLKKVRFVSEPNSAALPARLNETEQTWTITLKSVSAGASYDVFAIYEGVVIGKLRVVSYDKHQHQITLVPINEVKLDKIAIEQGLNTIYNPVGVQFSVDIDESMRGNYDWEVESEKDGLLSTVGKSFWGYDKELKESTEMLNLQKTYQQAAGTLDGAYLFVLNGAMGLEGQKGDLLGEMPRKSRFGYIFAGNSPNTEEIVHTIAHELGHGLFTLQHTFDSEYGKGTQGKTNNLLDYPSNHLDYKEKTELVAFQWNVMASPAIFTAADKTEETQSHYVEIKKLLDWIKGNRSKTEVQYNKDAYDKGFGLFDVPLEMAVSERQKIQIYAELGSSGTVDFSVNEKNITNAINFDLDFEKKYHTGFNLIFSYAGRKDDKEKAIKLWCYNYEEFASLIDYLGYESIPQEVIVDLYCKALNRAGENCNKLDIIYETAPDFVLDAIDDNMLLQHLTVLSGCDMSNQVMKILFGRQFDTDEEKAALNIISHIKNKINLYEELKTHPNVTLDLYSKIDSEENRRLLLNKILEAFSAYWNKTPEGLNPFYKQENIFILTGDIQNYGRLNNQMFDLWGNTSRSFPTQVIPITPKASHNPLDPVYLLFTQEPNMNDNLYSIVPAIYMYYISAEQEAKRIESAISWALQSTAVYGSAYMLLNNTSKVARTIAWTGLLNDATHLFFDNSSLKTYIETQSWGEDFIKAYSALSMGIDVVNIAYSSLQAVNENAPKIRKILVEDKATQKELKEFDEVIRKASVRGKGIYRYTIGSLVDEGEMTALVKNIKYLPGPQLPQKIAETFEGWIYNNRKLIKNERFYKYHGINNRSGKPYAWFTNRKYNSESELRKDLAIREDWGVQIKYITEFNVPAGTWISEGKAAAQGPGYPGQGYQAVIIHVPDSWIIRTDKAFK